MKNRFLLVLALGIALPGCLNSQQEAAAPLTKQKIEEAFQKVAEEQEKLVDTARQEYRAEMDKLDEQNNEKFWQLVSNYKVKKFGVNERIAQLRIIVPFSIPFIKEMFIAADEHDKEKLANLVANYLSVMYGKNWRKMLEFVQETEEKTFFPPKHRALLSSDDSAAHIIGALAELYFKERVHVKALEKIVNTIAGLSKRVDRLIDELGLENPSFKFTALAKLPSKDQIEEEKSKEFIAVATEQEFKNKNDALEKKRADLIAKLKSNWMHIASKYNAGYNLPPHVAQIAGIPFSIPLIKEMFIAADKQNKEKLKELVSQYLAIVLGNDWLKQITSSEDDINPTLYNPLIKPVLGHLSLVYFKRDDEKGLLVSTARLHEIIDELFQTEEK